MLSVGAVIRVAAMQGQIVALQTDAQVQRERALRYDHVAEVLASDKLAIRPLQPVVQTMPSRGMVYMDPLSGTGMVMCHNMPPLEQGHAYQVWFAATGERYSPGEPDQAWLHAHPGADGSAIVRFGRRDRRARYPLIQVPSTDRQIGGFRGARAFAVVVTASRGTGPAACFANEHPFAS